ncbi:MAG: N-acetylmuramoyl-L-alanine amidase [Peptococcus niger]
MYQVINKVNDMPGYLQGIKATNPMNPIGITVHNTANNAPALNEVAYMFSNNNWVSYHVAIDDKYAVEAIPFNRNAWHAGDGNGDGNRRTIGIEICYSTGDLNQFLEAEKNAALYIAYVLKQYNWTIENNVYKHQDWDWNGKYCPHKTLDLGWERFKNMIRDNLNKINNNQAVEKPKAKAIKSKSSATISQMQKWAKSKNADPEFVKLAETFYRVAKAKGVNHAGVYAQSAKETGFGKFGGVLDASYKNPCGMKTTAGGGNYDPNAHQKFNSWEEGITAQVDHLLLYAGDVQKQTPDPRHFPFLKGTAPNWEDLGGKWAGSKTYGSDIVKMIDEIENTQAAKQPIDDVPEWAINDYPKVIKNGFLDGTRLFDAPTRLEMGIVAQRVHEKTLSEVKEMLKEYRK